jgi:hypothetical protein
MLQSPARLSLILHIKTAKHPSAWLFLDLILVRHQQLFEFSCQHWYYFEQVTDDTIVSYFENICFRIFIDRNDHLGVGHTGKMLDGSGDTACNVKIRCYHFSCLTDLQGVITIVCVTRSSGSTYSTASAKVGSNSQITPCV